VIADGRLLALGLTPFHPRMAAGFFLVLSLLTQFGFDRMIRDAGYPGSRMISLPTPCSACSSSSFAIRNATATATTPFRRSLGPFADLNILPKNSFPTDVHIFAKSKKPVFYAAQTPILSVAISSSRSSVEFGMISAATSVLALLRLQADQRSRDHVCQSMPHLLHHHLPVRRRRHTSTRSCTHRRPARSL
jgi:hypothetical protein